MNYPKFIIAIVVLSAIVSVFSFNTAMAENTTIKCRIPEVNEAYNYADAVFVGKVVSEEKKGDVKIFEFEVEKYWKGTNKKKIKINVYETTRYQAWFRVGERYLIYAKSGNAKKLNVGRCSRSREAEQASEDLQKLGAGKNPD